MNVIVSNASDKPIYEQIYTQIKGAILRGECKEGEPLPSIRALAKELRISVITTKRAFDDLERDGFIYSVQGKGSFVAVKNSELLREEYLRQTEQKLAEAVELARSGGITDEELAEMFSILIKGE
ncbi:MAG TPA: GntR family transcriptional regulator [Candidatus Borkfalkia excrementigallinarum]|uniref:GntR family transcriptional regulator n=1 Tax=Candidatus Borkfalkia excrementigallinarum TaxID=2838506 RepID=A0A9D2CTG1_9FIRM|nr:GntR family transcriptional regulator [Candidatus Borkfalkia excrementigallinarum]